MGECEWWANVYEYDRGNQVVGELRSLAEVEALAIGRSISRVAYRIHVRLKPEGAPRRYADAVDRWIWENSPLTHGWSPQPPRTPKIEESAS